MLKLPRALADQMRKHAEETYPEECCGVLLGHIEGDTRLVVAARSCANARSGTPDRYAIAPDELITTQREARERGLSVVGFYHSHPNHPAKPSATDTAEAFWVGSLYVIVGVVEGHAGEIAAYALEESAGRRDFLLEPIEII